MFIVVIYPLISEFSLKLQVTAEPGSARARVPSLQLLDANSKRV